MNKMLIGMFLVMSIVGISNAAVVDVNEIPVFAVTASAEYVVENDIYMAGSNSTTAVDGKAVHTIDGIGFDERNGFHCNNGFRGTAYEGNMWIAPISPLPWIKFDLGSAHTLTQIKVWNCNSVRSNESGRWLNKDRLGMGIKDMEIVLYDAGNSEIANLGTYTLAMGPGREDVDFGQVLDIPDASGVHYVQFNILSNHGDAPMNQVGLAEVRFYSDTPIPEVDAGSDQNIYLVDNSPNPNSVVITLDGTITADGAVTPQWFVWPDDPNVVINDPNAIDTTATITGSTGLYYFSLYANDGTSWSSDYLKVRVFDGDAGLVFYWPFDEGTGTKVYNAVDTGLYDTDGVFYPSNPLYSSRRPMWDDDAISGGKSLRFKGGYIDDPYPSAIKLATGAWAYWQEQVMEPDTTLGGTGEVTASVWFKVNDPMVTPDVGDHKAILDFFNMQLVMRGNHLRFNLNVGFPDYAYPYYILGKTNVNDGQWHFAAVTFDGYTAKLYVDGRLDGQYTTNEGVIQPGLGNSWNTMGLGCGILSGTNPVNGWDGLLDEIKVYNLALNQAQIMAAYAAGGGNPCQAVIAGDMNGDCQVDTTDLTMLAQDWLTCTNVVPGDCF